MIEGKIIEKTEMIDTFPHIDIFSRVKIYNFYKFFYIILINYLNIHSLE